MTSAAVLLTRLLWWIVAFFLATAYLAYRETVEAARRWSYSATWRRKQEEEAAAERKARHG